MEKFMSMLPPVVETPGENRKILLILIPPVVTRPVTQTSILLWLKGLMTLCTLRILMTKELADWTRQAVKYWTPFIIINILLTSPLLSMGFQLLPRPLKIPQP